ncbi:hypothetical protein CYLTODRAFT_494463 [Cylindrobasidium torrendii FP15055 ss-10]|uniref:Uncharacterized protein n=1 Tax=Cylindrobasidium torrendii FP15055 ss-10 TaxID=1314674 RepID=A0A0D7AZJ1_9AGAR|nr:hypothetical protein CYLTODRAFT_494463 [Cylindrobasidium torrendii FP15055 ss-10]
MYELLASAVLHRHALGIRTPCVAFSHDPLNCQLRAMWAWSAPHKDHECLDVHVAHAPWSVTASHELGVFDIQDKDSATGLAMYLRSITTPLYMDATDVMVEVPAIYSNLMKDSATFWRVDQNRFFHKQHDGAEGIIRWLCDTETFSESLSSPTSIWPQQDEHGYEDEVAVSTTAQTDTTRLAVAKNSLAWAEHYLAEWRLSHAEIVFADPSLFSAEQSEYYQGAYLDPDTALSRGNRALKCYFPPPEFPDKDATPEPLKMSLEYIRRALPPSGNLPLTRMNQVTLPVLPPEIVLDNEGDIGIPFDSSTPEDIQAFLNFRAAAQVENWVRISLNMAPISPLDPAMTTYLMRNISTFSKVSELAKQANITAGPSEALYREIFDLIFGAHGDVDKVYKCFGQEVFTARQRYFDEQYTLADENLSADSISGLVAYHNHYNIVQSVKSLRESVSFNQLTTPLGASASKCFDSMENNFIERSRDLTTRGACLISDFCDFKKHWDIEHNDKALSAAALQAVTLDVSKCDGVLYTPLPIEMSADDLETVSLFRKASRTTGSSTAAPPSRQRPLPKPFRESLDALIDDVLPPTATREDFRGQLRLSDNSPVRSQSQHSGKLPAICLPLAFLEINQSDADPEKGTLQTNNLVMACRFLISLGIYDFPVFGFSTSGSRVRLFCAWAETPELQIATVRGDYQLDKIQSKILLADANCPEWDISKPRDAIRLGLFLQHLRTTHRDRLEEKFDEVKKEVSESWKHKDSWTPRERTLREWKMSQQKEGIEYKEWMKKVTEAWPEFSRLQAQVEQAQGAVDEANAVLGQSDDDNNYWW